jgi:hypothetical protein
VFGVYEDEREQRGSEDEIKRQRRAQAVVPRNADEQRCSEQLNRGITKRDVFFAVAAFRAQERVTEDWDVVVKSDRGATRRAARVWKDDRLFERESMNYNIEKTSDDRAEDAGGNVSIHWGDQAEIGHCCWSVVRSQWSVVKQLTTDH